MAKVVTAPDGTRWRVGRRWLPWSPRLRKVSDSFDGNMAPMDAVNALDDLPGVLAVIGVLIGLVLFAVFVVPLLIALLELAMLAVLVLVGVLVRIALRRPWIVDAARVGRPGVTSWKVVGWRRSGELIEQVASELAAGRMPPSDP